MKFIVDLWLDGCSNLEEMEAACIEFIQESLDFSASSVTVERYDEGAVREMVEALEDIAGSSCCQTPGCCIEDPMCDVMIAAAALAKYKQHTVKGAKHDMIIIDDALVLTPGQALWLINNLPKTPPSDVVQSNWRQRRDAAVAALQVVVDQNV